jgi:hypothetical protein
MAFLKILTFSTPRLQGETGISCRARGPLLPLSSTTVYFFSPKNRLRGPCRSWHRFCDTYRPNANFRTACRHAIIRSQFHLHNPFPGTPGRDLVFSGKGCLPGGLPGPLAGPGGLPGGGFGGGCGSVCRSGEIPGRGRRRGHGKKAPHRGEAFCEPAGKRCLGRSQ